MTALFNDKALFVSKTSIFNIIEVFYSLSTGCHSLSPEPKQRFIFDLFIVLFLFCLVLLDLQSCQGY